MHRPSDSNTTLMSNLLRTARFWNKKSLNIPKGGNQNPLIEEGQTTQWPKENVQRDKQRSTKQYT
jgi:hypothetical protein